MHFVQELTIPEQMRVWDKRAKDDTDAGNDADLQLIERIEMVQPKMRQALDIGCGLGRHLAWLVWRGWRATGVDWSQEALNIAHKSLLAKDLRANLVKHDFRNLPFGQGQFHMVVATNVLHHARMSDFRKAIMEIKKVLAIGAPAVISVPSIRNAPKQHMGNWVEEGTFIVEDGIEAGIPHHFFTYDELKEHTRMFRKVDIKAEYMPFPKGYKPLHEDQLNEWFWVTLTG